MKRSQMPPWRCNTNYVWPHFSATHILYKYYQTDRTSVEDSSSFMLQQWCFTQLQNKYFYLHCKCLCA